jgi:aconitate hydratase
MRLEERNSTQTIPMGTRADPLTRGIPWRSTHYATLAERVAEVDRQFDRPLTLAEKVLVSHLRHVTSTEPSRGETYVDLDPDRVALQDALAQIVALQFITAGLDEVVVPTTVHCDHLITARTNATIDLRSAKDTNAEVYDFLRSVCAKFGIGFWEPGAGIIHQVVLENYAFPGGMMIGTDSHTPNAGGLAMVAVGVGGGDAIDVMTGLPFNLRWPRLIGVHLTGALSGWSSPKDVILEVANLLTVSGGTGAIIEYFGPGADTISATGKATICNMGAEIGATTSIFPYDANTASYLRATFRADVADGADAVASDLRADPEVDADPDRFFDQVITIDLSELATEDQRTRHARPQPHAGRRRNVGARARRPNDDLGVARRVRAPTPPTRTSPRPPRSLGAPASTRTSAKTPLLVTPGSEQIRATVERDGFLDDLLAIGATVLANACGPCIGQWDRQLVDPTLVNTIVTSFNRNFARRNDGNAATKAFLTSPEVVVALALAGTLDFDPVRDTIVNDQPGTTSAWTSRPGSVLPPAGFIRSTAPSQSSADPSVVIEVSPTSKRLQLLAPFRAWDGRDYVDLPVLAKAKGSARPIRSRRPGKWLNYRGHLELISDNLFLGVVNAFSGATGEGKDPLDGGPLPYPVDRQTPQ